MLTWDEFHLQYGAATSFKRLHGKNAASRKPGDEKKMNGGYFFSMEVLYWIQPTFKMQ